MLEMSKFQHVILTRFNCSNFSAAWIARFLSDRSPDGSKVVLNYLNDFAFQQY